MELQEFLKLKETVIRDYEGRNQQQKDLWKGYEELSESLNSEVKSAFSLCLINNDFRYSLPNVDFEKYTSSRIFIPSFEVLNDNSGNFEVQIYNWYLETPSKERFSEENGCCAYEGLERILAWKTPRGIISHGSCINPFPEIEKFMKDYSILDISRHCHCGSDHK